MVVAPLLDEGRDVLGVSVSFLDITRLQRLQEEVRISSEEIQTTSEELQSTNEELNAVNTELRQRTEELNRSNAFLQSVLSSIPGAAIVVNQDLNVLVWNPRAEDLWGLRFEEVKGKSLLNLDIGLPVAQLRAPIHACLVDGADQQSVVLDAINRRGRAIKCAVRCTPLLSPERSRVGAILLIDEAGQT